jgi:hypothetical protein
MSQSNPNPSTTETGEQVPARPHDSGSAANETVDGLDYDVPPNIRLLVPRRIMLKQSRSLTGPI